MNTVEENVIDARKEFTKEKEDGTIDLIKHIVSVLKRNQFPEHAIMFFTRDLDIVSAGTKNPGIQRFLINKFWRHQLVKLSNDTGTNTVDSRFALIEDGDLLTWLELFEYNVLPTIKTNGLPKY